MELYPKLPHNVVSSNPDLTILSVLFPPRSDHMATPSWNHSNACFLTLPVCACIWTITSPNLPGSLLEAWAWKSWYIKYYMKNTIKCIQEFSRLGWGNGGKHANQSIVQLHNIIRNNLYTYAIHRNCKIVASTHTWHMHECATGVIARLIVYFQ